MAAATSEPATHTERQRFIGADLELMFAGQRRNVDAMMQMNRLTLDSVQQAWKCQLDFLEQAVEGFTSLAIGRTDGPRHDRLEKHAEYSRRTFETNLANARELTELTARAANDVMNVVSERFWDGVAELRRAQEERQQRAGSAPAESQPARPS